MFKQTTQIIAVLLLTTLLFLNCTTKKEKKMIVAPLADASKYYDLHPAFKKVFDFIQQPDFAQLEPNKYELDGDKLFCMVDETTGRAKEDANLEAHKKYIDIQYIISGNESMGWKPTADCKDVSEEYSVGNDIMFFNDAPTSYNKVPPGSFTIFFPKDAHAPVIGDGPIKKAVFKIAVEY
jgi:biofilm protein TabA